MSRHANDLVAQIFFVIFGILMAGVPLSILILGILNFVRSATSHVTIVLQALASILIWALLTSVIVMILIVVLSSLHYPLSAADEFKSTGYLFVGCLLYAVGGAALIYWTKRQKQLAGPVPEGTAAV